MTKAWKISLRITMSIYLHTFWSETFSPVKENRPTATAEELQKRKGDPEKGTYKWKSQSENIRFFRHCYIPYIVIILKGVISIFFPLYTIQDFAWSSYFADGCDPLKIDFKICGVTVRKDTSYKEEKPNP